MVHCRFWRSLPALTVRAGLLLFIPMLTLAGCRSAGSAPPPAIEWHSSVPVASATTQTLDLKECQRLAIERQPRVAAQRASLAAAEDGKRALDTLRIPGNLDAQVPIRRQQAGLGLSAAAAGLDKAEREAAYAVVRTYYTVLFAREQERVAASVVERLNAVQQTAQQALDAGARDVSAADVKRTMVYLRLAETRRIQASQGIKRALVALRESLGMGSDCAVDVPAARLLEPEARPNRDEVVAAALSRRGELIQARVFAQVAGLEVNAQATSHAQRLPTFAAGTDTHAQPVPQGSNQTDYRPAAVPPEMPTLLVGSRSERMKHARSLCARSEAMAETTRNLIALEAEEAFLRWEEASLQARQAKEAADEGDKMADELRKDFAAGQKVRVEEVVTARVLASQARSEYNEALFRQIIALADLERATAGGFTAGLK